MTDDDGTTCPVCGGALAHPEDMAWRLADALEPLLYGATDGSSHAARCAQAVTALNTYKRWHAKWSRRDRAGTDRIAAERARQDAKWGGPDHDDQHDLEDWMGWIRQRVAAASIDADEGDYDGLRKQLVEAGALCAALLDALDRAHV